MAAAPNAPRRTRNRAQRWCFTINARPGAHDSVTLESLEEQAGRLMDILEPSVFIYQIELGDAKTAHVQGYCEWRWQKDFTFLKSVSRHVHWEKAKANRAKNVEYCSKPEGSLRGPWMKGVRISIPEEGKTAEEVMLAAGKQPYRWQYAVLNLAEEKPHDRTVYWFWEPTGCVGKTFLCKCLVQTRSWFYGAVHGRGAGRDVLYGIAKFLGKGSDARPSGSGGGRGRGPRAGEPEPDDPTLDGVLIDVPRSVVELDMNVIEQIKNGLFFNGKYESQMVSYKIPHVFIFANRPPSQAEYGSLSLDRWDRSVFKITESKKLEQTRFTSCGAHAGEEALSEMQSDDE